MNRKTVVIIVILIILAVIALGIVAERAKGDSDGKLSREEQIRIMEECYIDVVQTNGLLTRTDIAMGYFQYRTKDR